MTFDEWLKEEEISEFYHAVETARDAWNAAMLEAMEAVDTQQPKAHGDLINKRQALLSIAEMESL